MSDFSFRNIKLSFPPPVPPFGVQSQIYSARATARIFLRWQGFDFSNQFQAPFRGLSAVLVPLLLLSSSNVGARVVSVGGLGGR